ncbi:SGNH/GDSL hydrolase family protein [Rubellicoccus peritrichatus]|uniref:SGNH/GDSL hydrolase family protein n=1 Tax=Rubellicoccus peritrichatus TaxID=3080537 RepID=A0AAQ3L6S8_9BACT|nr:SGNH/GDSL hydrolase family protein [Puniceicoccus sp. CR14]WOO40056.1 SGNH/GDSL hydrolase family protein [Puniceicoccus sp. CR14]
MSFVQDGIRFFNVASLERRPESTSILLPRIPAKTREALSSRGSFIGMNGVGVELQFKTEAPNFKVYWSAVDGDLELTVYCGALEHSFHTVTNGQSVALNLGAVEELKTIDKLHLNGAYDSAVWRIVVNRGNAYFGGIDTLGYEIQSPAENELPLLTWLAYGSSITNSTSRGYPHQAARDLGVQVLNKGMSGSCMAEPEMSDYLASLDWDFATCELGVNMRNEQLAPDFKRRVDYLLDALMVSHPGKPIGLITVFPNIDHYVAGEPGTVQERYSETLREIVQLRSGDGVFLIEGADMLRSFSDLHTDLLHPSDFGQVRMGVNLANILKHKMPGLLA